MDFDVVIHLGERIKELEAEVEKYKERVAELEAELERRKKKGMPRGGNTHKIPKGLVSVTATGGSEKRDIMYSLANLRTSLISFMELSEHKVSKTGKEYISWKKAMEYAKKDMYIKKYAKQAGVQITARNLVRWYKYHVTNEIELNTSSNYKLKK